VQAEMLLYMTATSPYYFPVVVAPVLVLCLEFNRGQQCVLPVTFPFSNIDITLAYPAANTSRLKTHRRHATF